MDRLNKRKEKKGDCHWYRRMCYGISNKSKYIQNKWTCIDGCIDRHTDVI